MGCFYRGERVTPPVTLVIVPQEFPSGPPKLVLTKPADFVSPPFNLPPPPITDAVAESTQLFSLNTVVAVRLFPTVIFVNTPRDFCR